MRSTGVCLCLAAFVLVECVASARALQPEEVPEGYQKGYHIVRPGESLRRITRSYLGSELLWESNWRLNPDIENPDFLLPGRRLEVLLRPEDAVPSAQVVSISGTVQERPDPIAWTPAQRLDLMVESDGIQTAGQSSTGLRFHDGTSLVVTEDSIVFLKVAGRTLRGIETRSVEIVEGQADLAGASGGEDAPKIEFVIGAATSKPTPGASGKAEARFRKSDAGSAQLMIYEGAGEVEAGGKTVAVSQGMGTSVPPGAPPLPPEKLLPRPTMTLPEPNGALEVARLSFVWGSVDGAAAYTVEVCSDPSCAALVYRALGLPSTTWQPETLPLGDFHWRVTAVSPSGLDGYPAQAQPVSVVPERAEFDPPSARFAIQGPSVERAFAEGPRTFHAASARVEVEVADPSGVASWQPIIDTRPSKPGDLAGGWPDGVHTVSVLAEDTLGNRGTSAESISFVVDAQGPELNWQVGGRELLEASLGRADLDRARSRRWKRKNRNPDWTLIAWGNEAVDRSKTFGNRRRIDGLDKSYRGLRLTGESPSVVLWVPGIVDPGSAGGGEESGDFLVLEASDTGAGVDELTVITIGSESTGYALRARSRDRLGNVSSTTWRFERSAP